MKTRNPSNRLKTSITALLQAACARPRFFVIRPHQPAEAMDVLEGLAELDPSHSASIASELTNLVDSVLSGASAAQASAERSRRLVARAAAVSPVAPLLLSLARSGFLREAATKAFPAPSDPFSLTLLLLRANDWVKQVRGAAAAKIHQFLDDPTIQSQQKVRVILGCIELIADPERFGRTDEASNAAIDRLRTFPGIDAALRDLMLKSRTDAAPRLLRIRLQTPLFDDFLPELAQLGRHHRVRQIALQGLLRGFHAWKQNKSIRRRDIEKHSDLDRFAVKGLQDRSVDVQRVALSYVVQHPESTLHSEEVLRPFLAHRSLSMVEKAVFGLRSLGVDVVEECRNQLRSDCPELSSVRLLALFGDASDGALIYAARKRSTGTASNAFLAAAARLGCAAAIAELRQIALDADDLDEARRASRALLRADAGIDFDTLKAALVSGSCFLERGLVAFAAKLSVVQMTHLAVLISRQNTSYDCSQLWRSIARRRNRGAFWPGEAEVEALVATVAGDRSLERKVFGLLGLGLPDSNIVSLR